MTTSTSRTAYTDCFTLFDRALASTIGIRTSCRTRGAANHLRTRLNYARSLDREDSKEIYPAKDDPNHGASAYDHLVVRVHEDGDGWWVYIEPRQIDGEIEELEPANASNQLPRAKADQRTSPSDRGGLRKRNVS